MRISMSHAIVGAISLLIGGIFLAAGWMSFSEYVYVKDYDASATGYITQKYFQRASDGNSIYYVDYWFLLPGNKKIVGTSSILKENWDILKIKDTFEVRYDKRNPDRNIPMYGGSLSLAYVFFIVILGTVFVVFGVVRFITGFKIYTDKRT